MNAIGKTPSWKRVLDIFCLIIALPLVVVLMAAIAVFIKLVSKGPVLIRQERIGFRCSRFMCWKFRTMDVGADTRVHEQHLKQLLTSDAPMVKMDAKGDPRLIKFGALLRASGLDELPQLINVLRGEMSWVGPRPCLSYEFDHYLPWQHERFDTLPGLTGLWQVTGKNRTTFTQMIHLDIRYARNKSLWLDLQILVATFGTLLAQMKAVRQHPPATCQRTVCLEASAPLVEPAIGNSKTCSLIHARVQREPVVHKVIVALRPQSTSPLPPRRGQQRTSRSARCGQRAERAASRQEHSLYFLYL